MTVDPRSADTLKLGYKGKIYYFCGESCRKDFQANPEKYVQKGAAEVRTTVKDLVCGMDVDPRASSTLKTQYKGKAYYFCSEHCKTGFETNPESYVQKQVPGLEPHISGMME